MWHVFAILLILSGIVLIGRTIPQNEAYTCLTSAHATTARLLIVTIAVGPRYDVKRLVLNRARYCRRHGCESMIVTEPIDGETNFSWMKLNVYQKHKAEYDYIWFLDADALIMNQECSIHAIIQRYDTGGIILSSISHIKTPENPDPISAGSFIVRNTSWSTDVIYEAMSLRNKTNDEIESIETLWEQAALSKVRNDRGRFTEPRFSLAPSPILESYPLQYRRGDFVMHFAGAKRGMGHKLVCMYSDWIG